MVCHIGISRSNVCHDRRRGGARDCLHLGEAMAQILAPQYQHSGVSQRTAVLPSRIGHQLWNFHSSRRLLSMVQEAKPLRLVVKGQSSIFLQQSPADKYQYNYIIAAGLDAGTAIALVSIWLFVTLPGAKLHWWGTEGYLNSKSDQFPSKCSRSYCSALDGTGNSARLGLPDKGYYGPDTWH
jgi:hypothetical protein